MNYDWADLAFASKKPLNELNAIFIAAPRELSAKRFTQLVKQYLPQGNIILGLSKDPYVAGLEDQSHFRMLELATVQAIIDKVNVSKTPHKIATLSYFQRETTYILEKLDFKKVVFINGSWYHAFHQRPEFYTLTQRQVSFEKVSPFADTTEAKSYAETHAPEPPHIIRKMISEIDMMALAAEAAKCSWASSEFQTGVALGRKEGSGYQPIITTHNRIVPYETYAIHHGSAREQHFSPPNDLNHYNTNHAEIELVTTAGREGIDLTGTTLFINLLPCPTCARMFTSTAITEFVYAMDHSNGYAIKILEAAGKTVRRLVPHE